MLAAKRIPLSSFRRSVAITKRQVHLQYVYYLFPRQPAKRSLGIGPKYLVDFPTDCNGITLGVSVPFGSNSIQLVLGVPKSYLLSIDSARLVYKLFGGAVSGQSPRMGPSSLSTLASEESCRMP